MIRSKLSEYTSFYTFSAYFDFAGSGRPPLPQGPKTLQKQAFPGKWAKLGLDKLLCFPVFQLNMGRRLCRKKRLLNQTVPIYIYIYAVKLLTGPSLAIFNFTNWAKLKVTNWAKVIFAL